MESQGKKNHLKGSITEELIASYFRKMGYFVLRGVEYYFNDTSVTDIDLWLYLKSSSITKEISIVDIKDRRDPKAFERILWTKGLQISLGADNAIVATTDNKDTVIEFGKKNNVTVLNGNFIKKLDKVVDLKNRLSEDEINSFIKAQTLGKIDGDWKGRLQACKSAVCGEISFNTINLLLENALYFAQQSITRQQNNSLALRLFYKVVALICISIDYIAKDLVFLDKQSRFNVLKSGFTYGNGGSEKVNKNINQGLSLIEQFGSISDFKPSVVKINIQKAFLAINSDVLAEYFTNITVLQDLFSCAIELEELSMRKNDLYPYDVSRESKSIVGCILDFGNIDRVKFGLVKQD